ncbi:uncharacterized protein LOC114761689 [Neltuma alba]|uniref:uncharacterized protein LOC114749305 n=1 Tax=Neltuma alba TaxID=207710 RepID=UPI0010A38D9D|nr:uncharacterized protein LOC114749305 [Prosopis alba]XP_028806946.1 uncharacterized protein LOC114761689 [Prosopis alba]
MDMDESTTSDPHGNVPFSWEKKAGVSKVHQPESLTREEELLHNLPPPPCTTEVGGGKISGGVQDIQNIPLPPCAFQPPVYRTSSKKGLWTQEVDDPFLAAYKECTKTTRKSNGNNKSCESVLRKRVISIFSCKRSCAVRDNNLVRISHVSVPHNVDKH